MNVTCKSATIQNVGPDGEFPGSFEVVLSTVAKDRDGDELDPADWKQPLPDHIPFDIDHGLSVATTVGSGTPTLEAGKLIVRGTYSSLPRAQETRTLVKEGHIRTTSVAFRSEETTKDGKTRTTRELLSGAFVAIPSNREAVVLAAKSLAEQTKAGARHSSADMAHIQAILDHTVALGARPADDTGAAEGATGGKDAGDGADVQTKAKYSAEQLRQMLADGHAYRNPGGDPAYPIADRADLVNAVQAVGRGGADHDSIRAYIIRRAKALGAADAIPDNWNADGSLKAATEATAKAADAADAEFDEALNLLAGVDLTTLPEPVRKALTLLTATDPDESTEETAPAAAAKAALEAETDDGLDLHNRLTVIKAAALAG